MMLMWLAIWREEWEEEEPGSPSVGVVEIVGERSTLA